MIRNKLPICPFCGGEIILNPRDKNKGFRDVASLLEFQISGLCQICQDEFFENEVKE